MLAGWGRPKPDPPKRGLLLARLLRVRLKAAGDWETQIEVGTRLEHDRLGLVDWLAVLDPVGVNLIGVLFVERQRRGEEHPNGTSTGHLRPVEPEIRVG